MGDVILDEAMQLARRDAADGATRTFRRSGLLIWVSMFAGPYAALVVVSVAIGGDLPDIGDRLVAAVMVAALALVWRTRVVVSADGIRVVNFWATIDVRWHQVTHVEVRPTSLGTGRMQVLTIDRAGGEPVHAWGVLRRWSGVLGPGAAQMAVARQVWARPVAERERVGQPRRRADHSER